MTTEALNKRLPTREELEKASEAVTALGRTLASKGSLPLTVTENDIEIRIELPPAVGYMMLELLEHIARGEMVTFVPYGAELTTQKAADLLNVSRPFLTSLLKTGKIPFHHVGSHRRVKVKDLLEYKSERDQHRENTLNQLQRLGQEFEAG